MQGQLLLEASWCRADGVILDVARVSRWQECAPAHGRIADGQAVRTASCGCGVGGAPTMVAAFLFMIALYL